MPTRISKIDRAGLSGTGMSPAHVEQALDALDEVFDQVNLAQDGTRHRFFDEFDKPGIDPFWIVSVSGGGSYSSGGGGTVQLQGGVGRLTTAASSSNVARLDSAAGLVNTEFGPMLEVRTRLAPTGTLSDMLVVVGLADPSFADAAYWSFGRAGSDPVWEAITGSDATVQPTNIVVEADTWYTMRIQELAGRVEFSLVKDPPTGLVVPVLRETITTDLPSSGVNDRPVCLTVQTGAAAAKTLDFDRVDIDFGGRLANP